MSRFEKPTAITLVCLLLGCLSYLIWASPQPQKSSDFASWAQVAGSMAAIVGSVFAGYLHMDRQARSAEAERIKAAYLLCRAAGAPVIEIERWLRGGALDQNRVSKDWDRVRNYPHAWIAWIEDRYEGYLRNLDRLDIQSLSDAAFVNNVGSVRSRLKWLSMNVSKDVGNRALDLDTQRRLAFAARDVAIALSEMRARADLSLKQAGRSKISHEDAKPFPPTSPPPHLKQADKDRWSRWLSDA